MNLIGLVDRRNINLWNSLNEVHTIEVIKEKRSDYLAFSKNDKTIISVPIDNLNVSSFTHELLHIYLRTKKVFIGGAFARMISESKNLSSLISNDLIEHIGNCLDHLKMFPEFLKLGFCENEFISDYAEIKLTFEQVSKIKENFLIISTKQQFYQSSAVDFYIGKYFAVKSCPNKSCNYTLQLNELKKIDKELFTLLENFLTDWNNFDYHDKSPLTGGYHLLLFEFVDNLEKWTENKTIV